MAGGFKAKPALAERPSGIRTFVGDRDDSTFFELWTLRDGLH